jgi:hypothetical protein
MSRIGRIERVGRPGAQDRDGNFECSDSCRYYLRTGKSYGTKATQGTLDSQALPTFAHQLLLLLGGFCNEQDIMAQSESTWRSESCQKQFPQT